VRGAAGNGGPYRDRGVKRAVKDGVKAPGNRTPNKEQSNIEEENETQERKPQDVMRAAGGLACLLDGNV
jgi:hypothetical protein